MSLEFEHFMGTNIIPQGALFHPDGQKYVFSAGACVVIGDLIDPHQQQFLRYHNDNVTCIAVSTSGRLLVSGQTGERADVCVYDYATQALLYRLEEHDHGIQFLALSDDEKVLASIGTAEDNNMMLWDMSNGCIIASTNKLPMHTTYVTFVGFVKDIKRRNTNRYQLCSTGADGLMLWDLDPYSGDLIPIRVVGDARATISRHITALHYTSDCEHIYATSSSGDYVVCNVKTQRIVSSVICTKMTMQAICIFGGKVYLGCGDKSIKVYTLQGELLRRIDMDGAVIGLSLSPDKLELMALTAFGSICRINLLSCQSMLLTESHTASVLKVVFDQGNAERIASISADHSIKVWDLSDYAVVCTAVGRREQEPGAQPWCLAFANLLFSGWSDGKILCHSAETGESLWLLDHAHAGGVSALQLAHNKRFLLTAAPSGDIRLWELRTREMISHLKEHKQKVSCLRLLQDDSIAMSGSRDRCILTWDLRNERRMQCHMQRMGGINDFVLSQCEQYAISVGQDRKLVVWRMHGGQSSEPVAAVELDGEEDEGMAIDISQDGQQVVTGGSAGVLRLWALHLQPSVSLQLLHQVKAHSKPITSVAFSKDSKQLLSAGEDGCIFMWWMCK